MRNTRALLFVLFGLAAWCGATIGRDVAMAAVPAMGTIPQPPPPYTPGLKGMPVTWSDAGGVTRVGNPANVASATVVAEACLGATPQPWCDNFTLTFSAVSNFWTNVVPPGITGRIDVKMTVGQGDAGDPTTDIDLYVFDASQNPPALICSSTQPAGQNEVESCAIPQPTPNLAYTIVAFYSQTVTPPTGYTASAQLELLTDQAPNTTNSNAIVFGPPTWADIQRVTGGEPMISVDPRGNGRVFVDFPWSGASGSRTSVITRSLDDGDSFRTLFDPACQANDSTIHCNAAGGGDSELTISVASDNVYHGDQVELFTFTTSASNDGGDTWPFIQPATSSSTGVDRMWMGAFGPSTAYLCYHNLLVALGQPNVYCDVTTNGGMSYASTGMLGKYTAAQTGNLEVDNTAGPTRGFVYHISHTTSAQMAVSTDQASTFTTHDIAGDFGGIFPWFALDTAGNLYAIWVTNSGGDVLMSVSGASATAPAAKWSAPVRVSTPPAQTTVLAAIAAGSPGQVALVYYGTPDTGTSDTVPSNAQWQLYVAHSSNALCQLQGNCANNGAPDFSQSVVTRRVPHTGIICTQGTTCTSGRNLLDMIDVGFDSDGRLHTTYSDDQSDGNRTNIRVAKEITGPSLLTGKPAINDPEPSNPMPDRAGDATWPNAANGVNQRGVDITQLAVDDNGTSINFHITLASAANADIDSAITTVTSMTQLNGLPARALYVVRFEREGHEYFVAFEYITGAMPGAFAGEILAADGTEMGQTNNIVVFNPHVPVLSSVTGNTLNIFAPLSAFGTPMLMRGDKILSVVATSLVGPQAAAETRFRVPIGVDATKAFDYTIIGAIVPDAGADAPSDAPFDAPVFDTGSDAPEDATTDGPIADAAGDAPSDAPGDATMEQDSSAPDSGADASPRADASPLADGSRPVDEGGSPASQDNGFVEGGGCACTSAGGVAGFRLAHGAALLLAFGALLRRRGPRKRRGSSPR